MITRYLCRIGEGVELTIKECQWHQKCWVHVYTLDHRNCDLINTKEFLCTCNHLLSLLNCIRFSNKKITQHKLLKY